MPLTLVCCLVFLVPKRLRGVWVGAQVDPLVIFVVVVSELSWG